MFLVRVRDALNAIAPGSKGSNVLKNKTPQKDHFFAGFYMFLYMFLFHLPVLANMSLAGESCSKSRRNDSFGSFDHSYGFEPQVRLVPAAPSGPSGDRP